jgi:hypothetical protein
VACYTRTIAAKTGTAQHRGLHPGKVFMRSRIGGVRVVDMLSGEQLPRIC